MGLEGFAVLREWRFADALEIEFQRLVFSYRYTTLDICF
ncbi:Protein ninB [Salmonella enterica subsp. enterica serovar Newport str. USMARC-S3124.1]|uniref:Uncharacterized protein n=1 Tax=Salmonella enterica subsp. enterica serovar Uganda str. R8-3404 TaxID=913083 RepID=A0A6C8H740_SALET|nr:Protein ninB [Salmonella enterica subsp. enterica serovar Newport str. USMARC-S3124.1]EHC95972.1 hypothetical protein LTSEUGA_0523 [Salmonella enterica subsp. enterica serovar Uganda str. R8-3404]